MVGVGIPVLELPLFLLRIAFAVVYTLYLMFLEIIYVFYPPTGKDLRGKHVLITGAGGALGRELALCFGREGCKVTCADVNMAACEETVRQTKAISQYSKEHTRSSMLDVTNREEVYNLARTLETPVDILVNNAGVVAAGGILSVSDDLITRIMDVNLISHFWTIRAFLPSMMSRNTGHVVSISSVAALLVQANICHYGASKAAASALMGCLRDELRKKKSNIKTTTVQPYFLTSEQGKEHWKVRTTLSEITTQLVAKSTVEAVKLDRDTVTTPTYLYFLSYLLRFLPTLATDFWRDTFMVNIDALENTQIKKIST